jgi:hypothetical protein
MRFEDSSELFGNGVGGSTCVEIKCEFCGVVHNAGNAPDDNDRLGQYTQAFRQYKNRGFNRQRKNSELT